MRRISRVIGLGLLGAMLIAGPASAAQPDRTFHSVDEESVDADLSEACGTEITVHITGHWIERIFFDEAGEPVREVNNYAFHVTYSSENGEITTGDVGADRATHHPDGSLTVTIIGSVRSISVPGMGRVYADVGRFQLEFDVNGELVDAFPLSGQHDPDPISVICSVLGD